MREGGRTGGGEGGKQGELLNRCSSIFSVVPVDMK